MKQSKVSLIILAHSNTRTFRRSWLPCFCGKKRKNKLSMPSKVWTHLMGLSPMQPCTIIQVSSSRSCMACKYTFNRKKISVKSLIKTVHVPFSDIPRSCRVIIQQPWWKCILKNRLCVWPCMSDRSHSSDVSFFSPLSAFYMHSQPRSGMTTKQCDWQRERTSQHGHNSASADLFFQRAIRFEVPAF